MVDSPSFSQQHEMVELLVDAVTWLVDGEYDGAASTRQTATEHGGQ